ncbi:MAG: hypothetical protein HQ541_13525 [Mariniphaga sp.]|nr:hypothetical protein [Mariniphaga sp.]
MKPFRSFLFIVVALSALVAFPLLFPKGKITISGVELRIYTLDFLDSEILEPELAQSIKAESVLAEKIKNTEIQSEIENLSVLDTLESEPVLISIPKASNNATLFYFDIIIPDQLANSWADLSMSFSQAQSFEKPLRILYYGDSQIENDRITSGFRKALQKRYGGAGRGLVPVESIYNTANNFIMTSSGNWETESVIKNSSSKLDLGLLCEAFEMQHSNLAEDSVSTSWVKIKSIKKDIEEGYSVLSVFYRASGNSDIKIHLNENRAEAKELITSADINELRFSLEEIPEEVELLFSTNEKITVYGLNLESPSGIMVDNIALRGRSYPEFSRIETSRLKQMAQLLDPAFVIMQYGVNVVPNITSDYSYYKKHLNRELAYLRKILPNTPVLLVSVSDMAHKANGSFESYPNLEKVLNTQKEAASENGCAFWNLYESMGGKGSMINWVEMQPPLGNKDYVHYTSLGAEKVGNLFAQQFIKALELDQITAILPNEP